MKTFVQEGDVLEFTAPSGGVTAGTGVKIGDLLVIPLDTVAQTLKFRGRRTGVVSHAKAGSQAWTEGAQVNWDDSAKVFTTVTTGKYRAGVALAAVGSGAGETTGIVVLHGGNLGAALS